jgi:small conductance mechanosensitive channel
MKNFSRLPFRRLELRVGISYADDIDKALAIGKALIDSEARVVTVKPPQIVVEKLGESSVDLVLRCWATKEDFWSLFYDLQKAVKQRFDAEGISIPFPQRELRILEKK